MFRFFFFIIFYSELENLVWRPREQLIANRSALYLLRSAMSQARHSDLALFLL